ISGHEPESSRTGSTTTTGGTMDDKSTLSLRNLNVEARKLDAQALDAKRKADALRNEYREQGVNVFEDTDASRKLNEAYLEASKAAEAAQLIRTKWVEGESFALTRAPLELNTSMLDELYDARRSRTNLRVGGGLFAAVDTDHFPSATETQYDA